MNMNEIVSFGPQLILFSLGVLFGIFTNELIRKGENADGKMTSIEMHCEKCTKVIYHDVKLPAGWKRVKIFANSVCPKCNGTDKTILPA